MANLLRNAKSGSDWTQNDLKAYNIKVVSRKEEEFFGEKVTRLPASVKRNFLEYDFYGEEDPDDDIEEIIGYLSLANRTAGAEESAVDDFAARLLHKIEYRNKNRLIRNRHRIPLLISGENRCAQTDICIIRKREELLLLLQEDKTLLSSKDAEAQVIAEAIAAFQENNSIRRSLGKEDLEEMIIPCITMIGTTPTFYLVPVTMNLSDCVMGAQYPNDMTPVLFYSPIRRNSEGMKPLDSRKKILQCFEAFKKFVDNIEKKLGEDD